MCFCTPSKKQPTCENCMTIAQIPHNEPWSEAVRAWALEGRTEEQIYGVVNFLTSKYFIEKKMTCISTDCDKHDIRELHPIHPKEPEKVKLLNSYIAKYGGEATEAMLNQLARELSTLKQQLNEKGK